MNSGLTARTCLSTAALAACLVQLQGCLDRPVAGTHPETQNIFIKQNKSSRIDKIDVLFMIDNSASMADKQQVMAAAVPQLLRRLTTPYCVNPSDPAASPLTMDDPTSPCPKEGYAREFQPVNDIHIGVITSSLGDMGGTRCDPAKESAVDDRGWLLGTLPRTAGTLTKPFLSWTQTDANSFKDSIVVREDEFRDFVTRAGETGCGYEMGLESWYRFLVDPEPPSAVEMSDPVSMQSKTTRLGRDDELLAQRKSFLRPDSLLAIVMLTDENDCSIRDNGISWLVTEGLSTQLDLRKSSSACAGNPNDPCCYSCNLSSPPVGCAADPLCSDASAIDKAPNLRCFEQKRRFGYDFLFPTSRYVNALKLKTICPYQNHGDLDCECSGHEGEACEPGPAFPNPLYSASEAELGLGVAPRSDASMVFLTGIVGVPWQDIAEPTSLAREAELKYRPATKIDWSLLLPDGQGNAAGDPLMRESIVPRAGVHPITQETISLDAKNSINGHEYLPDEDLQYACIFDLSQPLSDAVDTDGLAGATKDCGCAADDAACQKQKSSCSCAARWAPTKTLSPLCQAPTTGAYGSVQYAAKAYPAVRQLEVLSGHNQSAPDNSIVASICPKDLAWEHHQNPGYGYNPAVAALVDRLKVQLGGTCLGRQLSEEDGKLNCAVIEAVTDPNWANCEAKGREAVPEALGEAVRRQMQRDRICDGADAPTCDSYEFCALKQLTDEMAPELQPLTHCQNTPDYETQSPQPGFCYIDPEQGIGSSALVATCPATQKRKLRIVGNGAELSAPAPGWTFIACSGKPIAESLE